MIPNTYFMNRFYCTKFRISQWCLVASSSENLNIFLRLLNQKTNCSFWILRIIIQFTEHLKYTKQFKKKTIQILIVVVKQGLMFWKHFPACSDHPFFMAHIDQKFSCEFLSKNPVPEKKWCTFLYIFPERNNIFW